MMARKSMGLSERHRKILDYLEEYQKQFGYPPSIREIGDRTGISSTSVVNYYLSQLEKQGYIQREKNISRGIRVLKSLPGSLRPAAARMAQAAMTIADLAGDLFKVPLVGRIVAGMPVPVPSTDFAYFDSESSIDIARSLLPSREKVNDLFALEVQGDSMIDAMVNDGDIVVMKRVQEAKNGDMVAVWLTDRDETTLKYFYLENGRIRLQPANPSMGPIMIDNPAVVQVQGKVVLVVRRLERAVA
jgi:repressor LexA